MTIEKKMTYRDAGVDIDEGIKAVDCIKARMKHIVSKNVISGIGGFGGIFDISKPGIKEPALVSSIDGVGTKTKVASAYGKFEGIGRDIVAHCINDIGVQGARPLFFMDYIGVSVLKASLVDKLIAGMLAICQEEDCVLLGGETAEMPAVYCDNEFDLVGCIVGIVDKSAIITGKTIKEGDLIIGLPSSGLHTNGFSLARKVLLDSGAYSLHDIPPGFNQPLGDVLLAPHQCYGKIITKLGEHFSIHGIAHITGGGMIDNIPRVLPASLDAVIDSTSWPVLPVFNLIQDTGNIDKLEMARVFNMGIGITFMVDKNDADQIIRTLKTEKITPYIIGEIHRGSRQVVLH